MSFILCSNQLIIIYPAFINNVTDCFILITIIIVIIVIIIIIITTIIIVLCDAIRDLLFTWKIVLLPLFAFRVRPLLHCFSSYLDRS